MAGESRHFGSEHQGTISMALRISCITPGGNSRDIDSVDGVGGR